MAEPTDSGTPPGTRAGAHFGQYRLNRLLGEGGFGQVWEAEDTVMDRVVAVKLLKPAYSDNPNFRQRLYREARAAGRLHEPHVVPIHQCGEIDGQLYIDMRRIEGTDLRSVLVRRGPLSPARAVEIVRQVAAALDAAHTSKLIHRDVKPANVLLGADDFAYLVDFGLANAASDAKLTSTGTTIGTFAYMAPERLSNMSVSSAADIYALACVLYECLTGSPPYGSGDLPGLIAAHLTAPIPRPSQQRRQIPVALDDVIARGMAKNPRDRYTSAGELAVAARKALTVNASEQTGTVAADTQPATTFPNAAITSADSAFLDKHRAATIAVTLAAIAAVALVLIIATTTKTKTTTNTTTTSMTPSASTSTPTSTTRVTTSGTSAVPAAGDKYTIADYIRDNKITETQVHHGDPGSPTINLPVPAGWQLLNESAGAPYGGIVLAQPADASDPPTIVALVAKLTGNVDQAKIIEYAPGELQNLPGYQGSGNGSASTLGGFQAWQLGGTYEKNGKKRAIAQKTVVIPSHGALFVLQLNADALESEQGRLMEATGVIDDQTTITL